MGISGPSNIRNTGPILLRESIEHATRNALASAKLPLECLTHAVLGLAGAATDHDITTITASLSQSFAPHTELQITHDLKIALIAATQGSPGIVAVAGTGSACYGINSNGDEARTRNDDIGSGYWLTRHALNTYSTNPSSSLARKLLKHFGASSLSHLTSITQKAPKDTLAKFAPTILQVATQNDTDAQRILNAGAQGIATLICEVNKKLQNNSPKIVLAGGLLENCSAYRDLVIQILTDNLETFEICQHPLTPIKGAIALALITAHGEIIESHWKQLTR